MPPKNKRNLSEISPENFNSEKRSQNFENMPGELVGTMSKSELTSLLCDLLDSKMENTATKSDIEAITVAHQKIIDLNHQLANKIRVLETKYEDLENQLDEMKKKNTEKNLMLRIVKQNGTDEKDIIKNTLSRIIQPSPIIENQHIHEIRTNNADTKHFIINLDSRQQVIAALKESKSLRGTGINISKDLPLPIRQKRNKLLKIRSRLVEINASIKVLVRDDRMYVEKKVFRWSSTLGLLQNNNNGFLVLNQIYNTNVSDQLDLNVEAQDENNRARPVVTPAFQSANLAKTQSNYNRNKSNFSSTMS